MKTIRYKSVNGVRHGLLVKEARKYLYVILMDDYIRIKKLKKAELRYITEIGGDLKSWKDTLRYQIEFTRQSEVSKSCKEYLEI
jgi:hypothetical protein